MPAIACCARPHLRLRACASVRQLNMSARAYHRTLKLARTIADLAGAVPYGRLRTADRDGAPGGGGAVPATLAGMSVPAIRPEFFE